MTENRGIGISFFIKDDMFDKRAIKRGIYAIKIKRAGNLKAEALYVGQSVWMIVRCAGHLYKTFHTPEYMGLSSNDLNNENLELIFEVLESVEQRDALRDRELHWIAELKPLTQGATSDRQLSNKGQIVQNAVKELLS